MNLEFHYYVIYYLAREGGFGEEESRIIAYSSQYTDNNLAGLRIKTSHGVYETIPTQNYGWWDDYFPGNVYIPFHFYPGDTEHPAALRKDGARNPLNCTPGSGRVKKLLVSALGTRNPYRVGIAVHTYADTWAHQNFSGIEESWNMIDSGSLLPQIGHAQALSRPDRLDGMWEDHRLPAGRDHISNRERFYEAARMIYKYFRTYNRLGFEDHEVVIAKLRWMTGDESLLPSSMEDRIYTYLIDEDMVKYNKYEWYRDAVYDNEMIYADDDESGFVGYDKVLWMKDAFLHRTRLAEKPLLTARNGFNESHFFQWNQAAKEHLHAAKGQLGNLVSIARKKKESGQ